MVNRRPFLDDRRLLRGPWQAFERDTARLLLANGFDDVRIVGGAGDRGADVLAVHGSELWVVQCKWTSGTAPKKTAIEEVVEAGRVYEADQLLVATSRAPGEAFYQERARHERSGLTIKVASPRILRDYMNSTPEYPPARRELRDYQEDASTRFREGLLDTGRGQVVMATGLGKTVVMAELVADLLRDELLPTNRILILAHMRQLVDQLHQSFWYQLPKWISTHQLYSGEEPSYWEGITFATIQSVAERLDTLPSFDLVLVDEAHHIGAPTFRHVIDVLDPPMLGGVTATPWRGDKFDIDDLLGPPLATIDIAEGLKRGFLSDVDYRLLADNIDWELVQGASKYNYSLSQLNRKLILPIRDAKAGQIVSQVYRNNNRRNGIVYSPSIEHANAFAGVLRQYGLKAEAMSSDIAPRERACLMASFRARQIDIVTTVDLFNEGVDVPDVDLIVFMRVTHSRRIFVQQLGRGLRVSPGKDTVIVLDFVSDLRRLADVVHLDRAVRDGDVERLGLGHELVQFSDEAAGDFLQEWTLDQASLFEREGDPALAQPNLRFPEPPGWGGVQ